MTDHLPVSRRALALVLLLGCTSTNTLPIRLPDCTEGDRGACLCDGTYQGWRTCTAERRWGDCDCGDAGAVDRPPPACTDPFAVCGGACVSLLESPAHCGRCDSPCPAGQLCLSGGCVRAADAGGPRPDVVPAMDAPNDVPDAPATDVPNDLSDVPPTDAPPADDVAVDP